ncbi:MAG: ABC transporter permease, partial [Phycisphaeraceae bacterium]
MIVLVLLLALGEGLGALLWAQGEVGASSWLRLIGRVAAAGWLLWGLHVWREVPWVDKARRAVIALAAVGILAAVSAALGWSSLLYILAGVVGMSVTFFVGLWLVRLALSAGSPVIGVARTVVDEAIRMRMPVVFIVGVILVVPVLPFVLDPSDRLEYRLQSFLSWSSIAVSLLLSLMTIFLAIGTLTRELERRQVFLSLTKPVRRWQYLLGKWLGIASLNVVLVATAGVGMYAFTMWVADQPARDAQDRAAVRERVLVAREAQSPAPADPDYFERELERRRQMARDQPAGTVSGLTGGDSEFNPARMDRSMRQAIVNEWFTVGPRSTKTFVFSGLSEAKRQADEVQLRIEPKAAAGALDVVRLAMRVNGRNYTPSPNTPLHTLTTDTPHVLRIPGQAIDDDGVLRLEIANPAFGEQAQPTISFNPEDGLQLLYRVGGFAPNLTRSMALLWIRLAFLAALGLAAATFLGFPVAALMCTMVLMAASGGEFLIDS